MWGNLLTTAQPTSFFSSQGIEEARDVVFPFFDRTCTFVLILEIFVSVFSRMWSLHPFDLHFHKEAHGPPPRTLLEFFEFFNAAAKVKALPKVA